MEDIATQAVEAALAAGATYADARVMEIRTESMSARNGVVEALDREERAGVGVRALIGSSWGFFAVPDVGCGRRPAGRRAAPPRSPAPRRLVAGPGPRARPGGAGDAATGRASAARTRGRVGLAEKGDLLEGVTRDDARATAPTSPRPATASGTPASGSSRREGTHVDQHIVECGAAMSATAVGESETQRRSYPGIRGQYGTRGWELVRELDLPGQRGPDRRGGTGPADAPTPCPSLDATDLILGSEQMALQIHESVGHATELDRILGWEAAFAGTSWLDLRAARLAPLRLGADEHHRRRDAARRAGQLRLRRRGHARPPGRHRARTASGSGR